MTRRIGTAAACMLLAALGSSCSSDGRIEIRARYSRFDPAAIDVRAGDAVTFVVTNDDPIPHEFILGTLAEQLAHERGPDEDHDGTPGAASLEPGTTETVTFTFDAPGTYRYACHLAGHYAYGMFGTVTVV